MGPDERLAGLAVATVAFVIAWFAWPRNLSALEVFTARSARLARS
jgi:hypothetical protein